MKISIIGCGYVGMVTGVCLANSGHQVYFYDQDREKLDNLNTGKNLIFEKNLKNKLNLAKKNNNIFFCKTLKETILKSEAAFICVGTPLKKNNINLKYIKKVTFQLADIFKYKQNFSLIYKVACEMT